MTKLEFKFSKLKKCTQGSSSTEQLRSPAAVSCHLKPPHHRLHHLLPQKYFSLRCSNLSNRTIIVWICSRVLRIDTFFWQNRNIRTLTPLTVKQIKDVSSNDESGISSDGVDSNTVGFLSSWICYVFSILLLLLWIVECFCVCRLRYWGWFAIYKIRNLSLSFWSMTAQQKLNALDGDFLWFLLSLFIYLIFDWLSLMYIYDSVSLLYIFRAHERMEFNEVSQIACVIVLWSWQCYFIMYS